MQRRNFNLAVGDRKVVANLYSSAADKSGVLFIHGFGSNRRGYAEYASGVAEEVGSTCLTLDLGGHGQSGSDPGPFTINDHLVELRRAHDYLASRREVNPKRVGVVGASYGGFLAILLSQERPVKSLLLRAPAIYPNGLENVPRMDYDDAAIDGFRLNLRPGEPNRALEAVSKFMGSIALVRSEFDETIPDSVIGAYGVAAQNPTTITIPGASHALEGDERQMFKKLVIGFAREL